MATLALTPMETDVVMRYKYPQPIHPPSANFRSRWGETVSLEDPSWRVVAFSAIAEFESQKPKYIPGLGELAAPAKAANALRRFLLSVTEQSLPLPRLTLASGGTILLFWKNAGRSLEIASFEDGEVVLEALECGVLNEGISEQTLESAVSWLVAG